MSSYTDTELAQAVRTLKEEIAQQAAVLSQMYSHELNQRQGDAISDELFAESRLLNEKIERCMLLWQELKQRVQSDPPQS